MPGFMFSFGPEKGSSKGDKPKAGASSSMVEEESDEMPGDSPEQASLDAAKAAIEKGDPKLWIKAVEMAMRCCKSDSDDEEAPASERY